MGGDYEPGQVLLYGKDGVMVQRWIGAFCVFFGCGAVGFRAAASLRKEEQLLLQTKRLLENMECELSYRVTALPHLCLCARDCGKVLEQLYETLSEYLNGHAYADASEAMDAALCRVSLPKSVERLHRLLGQTLGHYDLSGQLEEITVVKNTCQHELDTIRENMSQKIRSCQTLGLCAGAALAILLV